MKKTKVVALILVFALVLTGFTACGGGGEEAGDNGEAEVVVVQIGYENNPGEPIDVACTAWAESLDELSGGTMKMQLYPSSQLGSKNDIIDQMLAGNNVITLADGAFMADRGAPDMGIQFAPFLFDSYDDAWALVDSDWWGEQVEICADNGLQILTSNFVYGTRNLMTTVPVNSVADLKGLKVRVPNNTIQLKGFEALGATATPLPLGDVYTALQQGTIDGVENPASALLGLGFGEVAKYLIVDKHVLNTTLWLCGSDWFNTLTAEQQGWLMESGEKAGLVSQQLDKELEQDALDTLEAEGVTIYYPTPEELQEFKDAALGFYEYSEIKEMFSDGLYETIMKEMGKM